MDDPLPDRPRKGRGAIANPSPRFDRESRAAVDDGWRQPADEAEDPPPLRTTVAIDSSRSIIARNNSPDIPIDQSLSRLRAWLRLLFRAADACLSGPLARARFRDAALCQDGGGGSAAPG